MLGDGGHRGQWAFGPLRRSMRRAQLSSQHVAVLGVELIPTTEMIADGVTARADPYRSVAGSQRPTIEFVQSADQDERAGALDC